MCVLLNFCSISVSFRDVYFSELVCVYSNSSRGLKLCLEVLEFGLGGLV